MFVSTKRYSIKQKLGAQSAMEFLMTYGWAILAIALVLIGLFSLGVFSSPGSSGLNACIGKVGYLCGTPVLDSNGLLLTSIGESTITGVMTVTGLGCSNSSAEPSTFSQTTLDLQPSQVANVAFRCVLSSNSLGAPFSGTLWIEYSHGPFTGLISQVGTVNTKVAGQS